MYVTVEDILKNIEKNGLDKARGTLFRTDSLGTAIYPQDTYYVTSKIRIGAACAMGQALINLGVSDEIGKYQSTYDKLFDIVSNLNDNKAMNLPFKEIADTARKHLVAKYGEEFLSKKIQFKKFDYTRFLKETA